MHRLAIFVHYDKDNKVDDYVLYYLKELRIIADDIVFVTTSAITKSYVEKLEKICINIIIRDNIGYDFMSYKIGMESLDINLYNEVIICNDSVYGPIYSLQNLFNEMSLNKECDFWGITDSKQFAYHLQSYFIVFKQNVITSSIFKDFWKNIKILNSKNDIIFQYEIGLSQALIEHGFNPLSVVNKYITHRIIYVKILKIALSGHLKIAFTELKNFQPTKPVNCNITLWFLDDIIVNENMPFIKVAALKNNDLKMYNIRNLKKVIESISNYPIDYIRKHLLRIKSKT